MKPPERLLGRDDLDPEIARMLRVASQPRGMTRAERERAAHRFARAFAIPAAAGSLLLIKSAALAGLIGAAGGLVVATGTSVILAPEAPGTAVAPPIAPRVVHTARAPSEPSTTVDQAATAALPDTSSSPPRPYLTSAPAPSVLPSVRQSASARDDDALGQEALLLEQARAALANDPARTLRLLETHRRLFPAGRLTSERELLRVDALGRLGRAQEARALAETLLRSSGGSLYEERLRKLQKTLGDDSSPSRRP
jgi:hypothetical protein